MFGKLDNKTAAVSGTKDTLQFPNLIIGRLPEKKENLEHQVAFFKRNFGYKVQNAHEEKIHCMAWNKEGTLLATGSYDKTVILYAFKDGKMAREYSLKGHNHSVDLLAWHPTKAELLLTYSSDKTVRLWNVKQRIVLQTFFMKKEAVSFFFSPDGKSFVLGDKEDSLTFIELEKGMKFEKQFLYEINEMIFCQKNGKIFLFLVTGTQGGAQGAQGVQSGRLEYFEYRFPELIPIHAIPVSGQTSTIIDMDPTGRYLAVGGTDSNVTIFQLDGIFPIQEMTRQKQSIRRISFSHDGRFLASMAEASSDSFSSFSSAGSVGSAGSFSSFSSFSSFIDVALVETGEKVWTFQNDERDERDGVSLVEVAFHPKKLILAAAFDCKRNHKDSSFIRLFGLANADLEKKMENLVETSNRLREKEKPIKEEVKDGGVAPGVKPRFESKFSFLRPTTEQLAGLEERKAAKEARDAKASSAAAARAAAKLPLRVATRLGVQAQSSPLRSGIRAPIRAPGAPASSTAEAESATRSRDSGAGPRKEEERKTTMAPPVGVPLVTAAPPAGVTVAVTPPAGVAVASVMPPGGVALLGMAPPAGVAVAVVAPLATSSSASNRTVGLPISNRDASRSESASRRGEGGEGEEGASERKRVRSSQRDPDGRSNSNRTAEIKK